MDVLERFGYDWFDPSYQARAGWNHWWRMVGGVLNTPPNPLVIKGADGTHVVYPPPTRVASRLNTGWMDGLKEH